jgi:hypothetical protein
VNTSVGYDASGLNPNSLPTFAIRMYEGADLVTPHYWQWYATPSGKLVYGSSTASTFTPSVFPIFSTAKTGVSLFVQATYSSSIGRRYCTAGIPISITKIGSDGATGATGPAGPTPNLLVGAVEKLIAGSNPYVNYSTSADKLNVTANFGLVTGDTGVADVTQGTVFAAIDDISNAALTLQGTADSDVKAKLLYSTGETGLWLTASGLIFQDKAGHVIWGWNDTTQLMTFSNYSFSSTRKNATVDRYGQTTRYAKDGLTAIYKDYTTGKAIWYNRAGRAIMTRNTSALVL